MIKIGYQIDCLYCGLSEIIVQGDYYNTIDIIYACDYCKPNRPPVDRRGFKRKYKKYEYSTSKPLSF